MPPASAEIPAPNREALPRAVAVAMAAGIFTFVALMIEVDRRPLWRYFPVTRAWEYTHQPSPLAPDEWRALVAARARQDHPDFGERPEHERQALEKAAARDLWRVRWQSLQMDWYGRTLYAILAALTMGLSAWVIARAGEAASGSRLGELLLALGVFAALWALASVSDAVAATLDHPALLPDHLFDDDRHPELGWRIVLRSPLLLLSALAGAAIALAIRSLSAPRAALATLALLALATTAALLGEWGKAPAGPYSGGLWTVGRVVSLSGVLGVGLGFLLAPPRHARGFAVAAALLLVTLVAAALALYFLFCTPLSGGALFEPE